jgi:hypothetical protein
MILPAIYLCMLLATASVDSGEFTLSLPVSQDALEQSTMYINQRHVVVYMANAKAPPFDERIEHGPVLRARGYPVAHGYVVSLLARGEPNQLRDALQKRFDPMPSLVVENIDRAPPPKPQSEAQIPHATSAIPSFHFSLAFRLRGRRGPLRWRVGLEKK